MQLDQQAKAIEGRIASMRASGRYPDVFLGMMERSLRDVRALEAHYQRLVACNPQIVGLHLAQADMRQSVVVDAVEGGGVRLTWYTGNQRYSSDVVKSDVQSTLADLVRDGFIHIVPTGSA